MLASRSHRIELIACLAALALGGCMKIYPDPELPDVEVEWYEGDCFDGAGDIVLTLSGVDDTTVHEQVTVACSAVKATFKDVARQRYKLEGSLLDNAGEEFNHVAAELDLRNGVDEHTDLYFGGASNFRVAWTFDMGASCASLGALSVEVEFAIEGQPFFNAGAWCGDSRLLANAPDGTYTVILRAWGQEAPVAASPELPDVTIGSGSITNAGTVVLTPCGADCP
jgi:hypothetical protein